MTIEREIAVLKVLVSGSSLTEAAFAARWLDAWFTLHWFLAFLVFVVVFWIGTHLVVRHYIAGLLR